MLNNYLIVTSEIADKADEIREIVENFSVMLLWRSGEEYIGKGQNQRSWNEQKYLFKSLFGDFATEMYKNKITKLQNELDELKEKDESMDFGIM
jgi:hypothetical protein